MGRRNGVRRGTARGCLLDGCLAVLVLLLVGLVGLWIWLASADDRAEAKARADMRSAVETRQGNLAGAAADGVLDDSEIARIFPLGMPAQGLVGIERQGPHLTVTAELLGVGPRALLTGTTFVTGCFAFEVALDGKSGPAVTVRELAVATEPQSACTAAEVPSTALGRARDSGAVSALPPR
ncbi:MULTISPECIES: hypothetical protein [unclassified Streptomyces]|uniref:hypothetical protein n=1 Tax=unclassified Streptomyces TaxID=2593676 RepID=UPI000805434F|nr:MULTISPECIES: hypothetical protein [unclassified Streptomyces]MYR75366.1 hypothetical protein [Streptomyces sp. SID4925]SBU88119.1 hypothetical protein YUMDRAFT_00159 [Streptomyces sp. OspMP-M45]